ncbi:MAG: hypothetical protein RSP_17660 [Rhodanobacter sp.]
MNDQILPPDAMDRRIAAVVLRAAGQIKRPSIVNRVLGLLCMAWLLAFSVLEFTVKPMAHVQGWPVFAWYGLVVLATWFLQQHYFNRDEQAGMSAVWAEVAKEAPADLVARVKADLTKGPLIPKEDHGPSTFLLLSDPDLTPDQLWVVLFWETYVDQKRLRSREFIADGLDDIRRWAQEKNVEPIVIFNETDLAVAQAWHGDRWHWAKRTRKQVQGWLDTLHENRAAAGNGVYSDLRAITDREARGWEIQKEGVGLTLYIAAHPDHPQGEEGTPVSAWIEEVRRLGQEQCDKELARLHQYVGLAKEMRNAKVEGTPAPVAEPEAAEPVADLNDITYVKTHLAGSTP